MTIQTITVKRAAAACRNGYSFLWRTKKLLSSFFFALSFKAHDVNCQGRYQWLVAWQRLLPGSALNNDGPLKRVLALWREHGLAFAQAVPGQGWPQRTALRTRLALLLRSVALDSAAAFIHLTLCALDLERLRAELLRRACFPRWAMVA